MFTKIKVEVEGQIGSILTTSVVELSQIPGDKHKWELKNFKKKYVIY